MLLSLDRLADEGALLPGPDAAGGGGPATRRRKHTFSSSLSSDYSLHAEQPPSQPRVRGHRSNSSSTFQSSLGRIDSIRGLPPHTMDRARDGFPEQQTAAGPNGSGSSGDGSTRARKGSKSSAGSSLDIGQMMGDANWQRNLRRRSASLDHGSGNRSAVPFASGPFASLPPVITTQVLTYDSYEAAPTPTIHKGPRRDHTPPPEPISPRVLRPISKQAGSPTTRDAPASRSYRNSRTNTFELDGTGPRRHTASNSREDPVTPYRPSAVDRSFAVGGSKTPATSTPTSANPPRERPGFFRRVFGSSKNAGPATGEMPPPHTPARPSPASARLDNSNSQPGGATPSGKLAKSAPSNAQPRSAPSNVQPRPSPRERPPPAMLNKKTSFFRRRKRSVSEAMPPMPVQGQQPLPQTQDPAHSPRRASEAGPTSPVSSLRKVMSPYLHSPGAAQANAWDDTRFERVDDGRSAAFRSYDQSTIKRVMPDAAAERWPGTHDGAPSPPDRESSLGAQLDAGSTPAATRPPPLKLDTNGRSHQSTPKRTMSQSVGSIRTQRSPVFRRSPCAADFPNIVPPRTSSDTPKAKATHSRTDSGATSGKDVPKMVLAAKPLASRDMNVPQPEYTARRRQTSSKERQHAENSPVSPRFWLQPSEERLDRTVQPQAPRERASSSGRVSEASLDGYKTAESKFSSPVVERGPTIEVSPIDVQSVDVQPVDVQPVDVQPMDAEPMDADPIDADPADADPVDADPVDADPIDADPIDTNPTETIVSANGDIDVTAPTAADREIAQKLHENESDLVDPQGAAAWLGEEGVERTRIRRAYMAFFDWHLKNVLAALRDLCGHLILKGETQQVDRILDAFSVRWCRCNPNHGFKATGKAPRPQSRLR
jgi:hypothetical protein